MDDQRFGSVVRSVRIKRGLRQVDLAQLSGVSASTISRLERGHLDTLAIRAIRSVTRAVDIRVDLIARWRAGDLDRLLNAGHAALNESVARRLAVLPEWVAKPEVSFAIYGERGIIDILAWHPRRRALLVIELKTDLADLNELVGTADRKGRLATDVAQERGWLGPRERPDSVSIWIIVAEGATNRRRVQTHGAMLRAACPADGRSMPGWLGDPVRPIRALSFWPVIRRESAGLGRTAVRRVSAPRRPAA